LKNDTKSYILKPIQFIFSPLKIVQNHMNKIVSTCVYFKNFALLYSRVGARAGAAGAASKFSPRAGAGAA
jgi:hypothetical protein